MPLGGAWGTFNPYSYQQSKQFSNANPWGGQGGQQQPPMPYAGAGAWGQPQTGSGSGYWSGGKYQPYGAGGGGGGYQRPYGGPQRPQGRGGAGGIGGGLGMGIGGRGGGPGRGRGGAETTRSEKDYWRQQNMMQNVGQMQGLFGQMPGYGSAMQDALKWMYAPGWGTNEFPIQQFIGSLTGGWQGDPKGYYTTGAGGY